MNETLIGRTCGHCGQVDCTKEHRIVVKEETLIQAVVESVLCDHCKEPMHTGLCLPPPSGWRDKPSQI